MHVTAINYFEKQKKSEKAIKHLKRLKQLIDNQEANELISQKAYTYLTVNADYLMEKWD